MLFRSACLLACLPACLSAGLPARLPSRLPAAAAGWSDQLHGERRQARVHHRRQIQLVPRTLPLPPACLPVCAVGLLGWLVVCAAQLLVRLVGCVECARAETPGLRQGASGARFARSQGLSQEKVMRVNITRVRQFRTKHRVADSTVAALLAALRPNEWRRM